MKLADDDERSCVNGVDLVLVGDGEPIEVGALCLTKVESMRQ